MLFFYRVLINLITLLSPIIITYRLIKKRKTFLDLKRNLGFLQKKEVREK